ncbi:hypothetical protein SARC_10874 [Sphaeroforma arctica JP610]|uniref:Uncharacterized protein n=1 Tax=Sphaeroforma arctica JP610 TaxID=667725 RepID=A0A0L0FKU6_9EUKA|nr:hypothetical protein SARC_10874 [Sphaeroforma arctica JP610]KNC76633.1 hypothetical protein SARC_10874 [Sphaeroforma arctica JP610]|eukprot:XP_014150535.1 hypothetical protein SARC_10874 [Sphaeroforma arctica JP610]
MKRGRSPSLKNGQGGPDDWSRIEQQKGMHGDRGGPQSQNMGSSMMPQGAGSKAPGPKNMRGQPPPPQHMKDDNQGGQGGYTQGNTNQSMSHPIFNRYDGDAPPGPQGQGQGQMTEEEWQYQQQQQRGGGGQQFYQDGRMRPDDNRGDGMKMVNGQPGMQQGGGPPSIGGMNSYGKVGIRPNKPTSVSRPHSQGGFSNQYNGIQ